MNSCSTICNEKLMISVNSCQFFYIYSDERAVDRVRQPVTYLGQTKKTLRLKMLKLFLVARVHYKMVGDNTGRMLAEL